MPEGSMPGQYLTRVDPERDQLVAWARGVQRAADPTLLLGGRGREGKMSPPLGVLR